MFGNPVEKIEKLASKNKSEKIIGYLNSKDKDVRMAAIKGLGVCGGEQAVNQLNTMIHAPEIEERAAAIESLGNVGSELSLTLLSQAMANETDAKVLQVAREAIIKIRKRVRT